MAGLAPVFDNVRAFKQALRVATFDTREEYLKIIKFGTIKETKPYPESPTTAVIIFAQHFGLVETKHYCAYCGAEFDMKTKKGGDREIRWSWRGPRYGWGCSECDESEVSMVKGTILEKVKTSSWIDFFDVLVMWLQGETPLTMKREVRKPNCVVDPWVKIVQKAAIDWINSNMTLPGFHESYKKAMLKKKENPDKKGAFIVQADEAYLNKGKLSKLAPGVRPKKNKVWLWGLVVQGHPEQFFFRLLEFPEDAYDGRPRGKKEMILNFDTVGLRKGMTVVSDSWRATIAALKHIKQREGWTNRTLPTELVVHSKGQVKNRRGYNTNAIENRWSVLKRWIKKTKGGKLPPSSNRRLWNNVVTEFQYRKVASKNYSTDGGHTFTVATKTFFKHITEVYSS